MKHKALFALALGAILIFSLTACGSSQQAETNEPDTTEKQHSETLVVYFSATGTTKGVAEKIAALTGADIKEIVPTRPYTADDLNYNDRTTHASREQNTPDARPEIAEDISFDGYATVYLGYPIWWGQAPRILNTFVERHDFNNITVIPFCTSGSSDIGQSDDTLAEQAGNGNWLQGKRFSKNVTESDLQAWINETEGANMEKTLRFYINNEEVSAAWENNDSVDALIDLAASAPLTVKMSMHGGFEQVGPLGTSLPNNDSQMTASAGDIMLYSSNQIVVFYGSNSWTYTKLGEITGKSSAELKELLGSGNVVLTISID